MSDEDTAIPGWPWNWYPLLSQDSSSGMDSIWQKDAEDQTINGGPYALVVAGSMKAQLGFCHKKTPQLINT